MFNYSPVTFQHERNATIWLIIMGFMLAPGVFFEERDVHNHVQNIHCTDGPISLEHRNNNEHNST